MTDSGEVELILPNGIDPARSRVSLSLAHSPLATLRQARRFLRVYPYECTEQVASEALAVMAGLRVELATPAPADTALLRKEIAVAVSTITRRQRVDGGIGLWSADDWTSPWLSAYAGEVLLEARRLSVPVNDSVVARLAGYLTTTASKPQQIVSPVARWYSDQAMVLRETVAAADFLSQLGQPQVPAENELLRLQAQLTWEDRVRLAEMLARRKQVTAARGLLTPAWAAVKVEGRRAVLPTDANANFYFPSSQRAAARLLTATLAVNPAHALVGPLVETLLTQRHQTRYTYWNTQDYGAVVRALSVFEARQKAVVGARGLVVRSEGKVVARLGPQALTGRDFTLPLTGMVFMGDARGPMLKLALTGLAPGVAEYYAVTVDEVPSAPLVMPDQKGIQVERWYEDFVTGRPIIEAAEGALVRVRLRVTIPSTRQFLVLDDPLPAGLEAVDLSLRTASGSVGPANGEPEERQNDEEQEGRASYGWGYGSWDSGWWSPFDHREMRDDRVVYVATELWAGTFSATYVARATTPGVFVRPPAHAEEMYNPAVQGRSDGGVFTVTRKTP